MPVLLWQILFYLSQKLPGISDPDLSCVDYYMGMGRIKRTFEEQGLSAQGYEVHDSPTYQNACTLEGFITMILFAMRLFEEALGHWGTVCSSWVVLSRNSTLRTPGFIRGDTTSSSVRDGNTMVCRMALTLILMTCRNCARVLEQPGSSIMHFYTAMQGYHQRYGWFETRTPMGDFGGETLKPTVLRSNRPWIQRLKRRASKEDIARFKMIKHNKGGTSKQLAPHMDGRKRFGGNSKNLKESQVYPRGYATQLHKVRNNAQAQQVDLVESSSDSDYPDVPQPDAIDEMDMWKDLNADGLAVLMDQQDNVMPVR